MTEFKIEVVKSLPADLRTLGVRKSKYQNVLNAAKKLKSDEYLKIFLGSVDEVRIFRASIAYWKKKTFFPYKITSRGTDVYLYRVK